VFARFARILTIIVLAILAGIFIYILPGSNISADQVQAKSDKRPQLELEVTAPEGPFAFEEELELGFRITNPSDQLL